MTLFERIKKLAQKRGKNVQQVAQDLGFGINTFYKWKKQAPNGEYLSRVADYFHVSVDYLLGREDEQEMQDQKDLKKFIDDNLNAGMTYDGENLTEEQKERLKVALTQVFWKYKNKFKKD